MIAKKQQILNSGNVRPFATARLENIMKLLVIDIQKGITDERLYNFENFIKNTVRLINAARQNKVEVIYVQHDDGEGSGFSVGDEDFEIASQVTPLEGEKVFIKTINSCFGNREFLCGLFDTMFDELPEAKELNRGKPAVS